MLVEHLRLWPGNDTSSDRCVLDAPATPSVTSSLNSTVGGVLGEDRTDLVPPTDAKFSDAKISGREMHPYLGACETCGSTHGNAKYSLFCVFDGHNGVHAARMASQLVLDLVESRLPVHPGGVLPSAADDLEFQHFRERIQLALVMSTVELNRIFAEKGIHAGCTATIVLQVGLLVTAVNLGDSRAVVDTGSEVFVLTADHRVASNKAERHRVQAMGALVAPLAIWGSGPATDRTQGVGPLRIWPGGLSISRAIGDFDVGDSVLPFPYLCQVMLPPSGGRLVVASDGVWDAFDKLTRVTGMARGSTTENAPSQLIQTIIRAFGGLKDDTTVIVVDILPHTVTFPETVSLVAKRNTLFTGSVRGSISGLLALGSSVDITQPSPAIPIANNGKTRTGGEAKRDKSAGVRAGCFCFGGGGGVSDESDVVTRPKALHAPAPVVDSTHKQHTDASTTSSSSSPSASRHQAKHGSHRCVVLTAFDVAGLMGLMPALEPVVPAWYTPELGEGLFASASEASAVWQIMRNKLLEAKGRPKGEEVSVEGAGMEGTERRGRRVAFSEEVDRHVEEREEASLEISITETSTKSSMRRNASHHFLSATADDDSEFASKFGHYSSLSQDAISNLYEPSVRAGRVYNSEASLHAGSAMIQKEDPTVRLRGSSFDGSVHWKASTLPSLDEKKPPLEDLNVKDVDSNKQGQVRNKSWPLPPVRVVKRTGRGATTTSNLENSESKEGDARAEKREVSGVDHKEGLDTIGE